jgi:hypothetical protein
MCRTRDGDAVTILAAFLPMLIEFTCASSLRGQGWMVKFKGRIAWNDMEFALPPKSLKTILAPLANSPGGRQ